DARPTRPTAFAAAVSVPELFYLDAGKLDHLRPFGGFVCDVLAEIVRRHGHRFATELGDPCLQLRVGKSRVNLFVELHDNIGGRAAGRADTIPLAPFETREGNAQPPNLPACFLARRGGP